MYLGTRFLAKAVKTTASRFGERIARDFHLFALIDYSSNVISVALFVAMVVGFQAIIVALFSLFSVPCWAIFKCVKAIRRKRQLRAWWMQIRVVGRLAALRRRLNQYDHLASFLLTLVVVVGSYLSLLFADKKWALFLIFYLAYLGYIASKQKHAPQRQVALNLYLLLTHLYILNCSELLMETSVKSNLSKLYTHNHRDGDFTALYCWIFIALSAKHITKCSFNSWALALLLTSLLVIIYFVQDSIYSCHLLELALRYSGGAYSLLLILQKAYSLVKARSGTAKDTKQNI